MPLDHKSLLSEFGKEAVASHSLIAAEIMSGERPANEIMLHLAAEVLAVDKLTVLSVRSVDSVQAAHDCWVDACECFSTCADLWERLPHDDLLAGHRRLLERLIRSAEERREFYTVTDGDRRVYNATRDFGMPLPLGQCP